MLLEGVIVDGRVEFDTPTELAEGTRVRVEPVPAETVTTEPPSTEKPLSPLARRLLALAGKARGLPPDMAENHNHYIHGTRKR
jgi:hypothetical protein